MYSANKECIIPLDSTVFLKESMTVTLLKQRILNDHNKLIEQLEEKYNDRITQLLEQKKVIIIQLQNALFQQFEYIDDFNKGNDQEEILIDDSESNTETEIANNTNQDPIFSLKDIDPNDSIESETKVNDSNGKGGRKYKCNICHRLLSSKPSLKRHVGIHSGEKPFKCSYCNYRCRFAHALEAHERVHTGEKPFKCNYCEYRCRIRRGLKEHIRIHTGEKPYKCDYCPKKFRTYNQCKNHKRTHT